MDRRAWYREIDELLAARARDFPRRVEPTWPRLLSSLEELARSLRETARRPGSPEPSDRAQAAVARLLQAPVFVVGYRKSGTTLLSNLLDGHPELGAIPYKESKYFTHFVPQHGHLDRLAQVDELQRNWVHWLINPTGQPPFWLLGHPAGAPTDPYEQFTSYLYRFAQRHPEEDLLGVLATTIVAVRLDQGQLAREPTYWVEKTPTHELHADRITELYPESRFLHIVRDPRGAVAAIQAMRMNNDAWSTSVEIKRTLAAARSNLRRVGPGRYLIVGYEELVRDTRGVMERIAEFLGLEFDETLLSPTAAGQPVIANSAWPERRVMGEVHSLSLDTWRQTLDRRSQAVIIAHTAREAHAIGYELPQPNPVSRLATLSSGGAERVLRSAVRKLNRSSARA